MHMTNEAEQLLIGHTPPRPVLHALIAASAEREYSVVFRAGNGSPLGDQDYLRFALHYYARVLYELARADGRSVRDLPSVIERIVNGTIGWHADLFALAEVRGSLATAVTHPVGDIDVVLRHAGIREFEVEGQFRLNGRALALSVIAVLQAVLSRVSGDTFAALFAALANMNVSYTLTHHYRDPKSFREVPTIAEHAAAFI